jgi:subtilisin family serine protease
MKSGKNPPPFTGTARMVGARLPRWIGPALMGVVLLIRPVTAADDPRFTVVNRPLGVEFPDLYVPDEFVVEVKREVRGQLLVSQNAGRAQVNHPGLQQALDAVGVVGFQRQFVGAKPQPAGGKYPDLTGYYLVKIGGGNLQATMAAFARNPSVERVEPIGLHPIFVEPNDPYYRDSPNPSFPYDQWHYFDRGSENKSIQADLAWDLNAGSSTVYVGILDTGVRYYHWDLGGSDPPGVNDNVTNGNIFINLGEIPGNGIDDDGNGFVDDVVGYDFVSSASGGAGCSCSDSDCGTVDNDPRDHNGHGTHVSGTVAAITNNNVLAAGVAGGFAGGSSTSAANGVKVIPLRIGWNAKCFGADGYGFVNMAYAASAMNYVANLVDQGYKVAAINCSWGSSNSGGIDAAVNALLARNVSVVHAAGNSNSSSSDYLGTKAGVISVAATTRTGTGASFTNYGSWVEVAAPGVGILSTFHHFGDPANDYIALMDGTSMAAPHVAGIAALLTSCNPSLSGTDKRNLIMNNVRAYSDSRNLGTGIANAYLALQAAGCTGQPQCTINGDCNDGDACTTDVCSNGQCSNTPINCNDGNACTTDSCSGGTCFNDPITCNDGNACTTDSCNPSTGCVFTPINCDDGNLCTSDSCSGGTCSNTAITCNDNNACTTDSCNPSSGCVYTPVACGPSDGCCPSGCSSGSDPDCTASQALVNCITYTTRGGAQSNNHLDITVSVINSSGSAVSGATVSATVTRPNGTTSNFSGSTSSSGTVVFSIVNAANGCYSTAITNVTASGLTWDATYPGNGHNKGVDAKPDADCRNCGDGCGSNSCGQ